MSNIIGIAGEIIMLVMNVLILADVTAMKKEGAFSEIVLYLSSGVFIAAFFFCSYSGIMHEMVCFFLCYVLPCLVLLLCLSKYKDSRFLVSFCMVNSFTVIAAFLSKMVLLLNDSDATKIISSVLMCVIMSLIYILGKERFKDYRYLISCVSDGWGLMALSAVMIYVLLVFSAAYPEPITERISYVPAVLVLSVTVVLVYAVFIKNIFQKKTLYDLNNRFVAEQNWHNIAHKDALTGMGNRLAYIERINELENSADKNADVYMIVLDINNFKEINDTKGHFFGDETLKKSACVIWTTFCEENCMSFRIGGDEFAVIALGITKNELERKLGELRKYTAFDDLKGTFSIGCTKVDFSVENAMETAFMEADKSMYEDKQRIKIEWKNKAPVLA